MRPLILSFVIVLTWCLQSRADIAWNPPSSRTSHLSSPPWSSQQSQIRSLNFLSISRSMDELMIVLQLDDVSAIQRVVGDHRGARMVILQATDGRHLIRNIYDPSYNLKECKATKNQDDIDEFRSSFQMKYSSEYLSEGIIHRFNQRSLKRSQLPSLASVNLEYVHNATKSKEVFVLPRTTRKELRLHPTIRMMTEVMEARRVCRDMEKSLKAHLMMADKTRNGDRVVDNQGLGVFEEGVELDIEDERVSRERRSIFIVPGTLWCGAGNIADSYDDLGEHETTDMCCREHDHCPHTIESWQNKFSIFNHRLYTLSDCRCDVKFRDCLLRVNTSVSRSVGDAYFNLLGCACFNIKEEEECISRSWWPWNACSRYQQIKRAIVNFIGPVLDFMTM
ncbi:uncharacterized protein LOC121408784 [Lytechinus variegatus]|uniref:uncharacterized protein LOC121408784 n=1 Tax=Lytechinus variegatus TaxID=7654 RepID=UPI001BB1A27A|nr:uncharacterized protein LOC121408784 [Lytechinus variegatus]